MNKIDKVFDTYIQSSNTYNALMITGEWGCGKTFYFMNNLKPKIESYGLDPIYISLNGVQNQTQLRKIILTKAILGNEKLKRNTRWNHFTKKFRERLTRVIGKIDKIDPFLSVFDINDFIDLENVVYCFDDLERISKEFPIDDLLGFINTEFVEHKNNKVIIIGDETKRQLSNDEYVRAKEKIIGWTITYDPNFYVIGKVLVGNYCKKPQLKELYSKHEDLILELIVGFNCKNLRTVLFFLDCVERVFVSNISCTESIERDLIYFTFIMSQEYKQGNLALFKGYEKLPSYITNTQQSNNSFSPKRNLGGNTKDVEKVKSKDELRMEEYASNYRKYTYNKLTILDDCDLVYTYFDSIYGFVTNGYLDFKKLNEEIVFISSVRQDKRVPEELNLITRLAHFRNMQNEEFSDVYQKVIEGIIGGDLNIYEFARASEIILNLNYLKIIEEEREDLLKMLLENIDKAIQNTKYVYEGLNEIYAQELFDNVKQRSGELHEKLLEAHQTILSNRVKDSVTEKFDKWKENVENGKLLYQIVENINPKEICEYIANNLRDRLFLEKMLIQVGINYRTINAGEHYSGHIEPLSQIRKNLNEKKVQLVDQFWIKLLDNRLNEIIQHLEKTKIV